MYRFSADGLLTFYNMLQKQFTITALCTSVRKISYDVTVPVWVCHELGSYLVGTEVHGKLYCSLGPWQPPEVYIKAILQDDMPDCTVCALNEMMS